MFHRLPRDRPAGHCQAARARVMFENSTVCHAIDAMCLFVRICLVPLGVGWVLCFRQSMILAKAGVCLLLGFKFSYGEFDPGSGRTLAACLTHASRAVRPFRGYTSGERVSNT